jgi:hypothetical protein
MKMNVLWVVVSRILVEVYQWFRGVCCPHHQGNESLNALIMEVAGTSEMSVNFYQTTWHNNPEDSHFHASSHENLKFYVLL